ncbi:MAG: kynureninase [Capsulimonadales bacterium]|nr:kynureninase [Capsulimonadales bacterium]
MSDDDAPDIADLKEEARQRDGADPLRYLRDRFYLPPGRLYFDGNSLGPLSRDAETEVSRVLDAWRVHGVEGWTEATPPWFFLAEELGARVAPLIGAEPTSVIVTGSTTVNLHQLLATLYHPEGGRHALLIDALAFPSDTYALESHLRLRGLPPETHLRFVPSRDGRTLRLDDLLDALTPPVRLAVLPSVIYTSGQLLDMERLTAAAREREILLLWDLSHSLGIVPHALDAIGADGAFWCHYKYLNAGPGAVGGLYLNRRHFDKRPGLAGWFGSDKARQFDMSPTFVPAVGAGALQIGTPPILAMAPLLGALRIHEEVGLDAIREKSLRLVDFLRRCARSLLTPFDISFALPDDLPHGGHLALTHPEAKSLSRRLRENGVVPDFRPPDILRLAPVPLYLSYADCLAAVITLRRLLQTGGVADASTSASTASTAGWVP